MWRNNIEPVISEDQESCYQSRTAKNAEWSDITLAFAVDVNSPGELETKAAAGDKFLSFEIPDRDETITETSYVKGLVSEVVSAIVSHPSYPDLCRQGIKLNIAGNRLSVLARHGISQDGMDNLLLSVMKGLLKSNIPIAEVRSGGQSGVDEAGIHAAQDCSLPCSILCPKGFRFSTAEGEEPSGAERFMARFKYKGGPVCNTIGQEIRKIQYDSCQEAPIPTSFKTIDRALGGIRPSQLVILASRSGVGKSSFAMTMARNIAVERDIPTAYFTMQLSSEIFTKRLLRQEASIALHHASGVEQCNGEEMGRVTEALSRSPLYVDDTRFLSIDEFLIKAEKLVRENGVRVMIIDFIYLMLMQKNKWGRRRRGTDEDFRQAIRTLKHAASELRVAIMILVNMPQSISPGQSPVPTLINLYEQGLDYDVLKENVDMVWMLYRPGMYGLTNDNSKAKLIVAHNAHGDRDLVIDLKFEADYARFTDSPDEM